MQEAPKTDSELTRTVTVGLGPRQTEALEYLKARFAESLGEEVTDDGAMRMALMTAEQTLNPDKFVEVLREALSAPGAITIKESYTFRPRRSG